MSFSVIKLYYLSFYLSVCPKKNYEKDFTSTGEFNSFKKICLLSVKDTIKNSVEIKFGKYFKNIPS